MDPRQKDFDERHTKLPTVTALTKREYFAAMALQAMISNPQIERPKSLGGEFDIFAAVAIRYADSIIKQLEP